MSTHEATTQQPLLLATDLKKYYPVKKGLFAPERLVKALDGVSFTLERGKTLAVVGESGCGKSTLGRLLTMIEIPTGGELYYQGQDLLKHDPQAQKLRRQKIQIVFQNPYGSLNPRKKVGQILEEPLQINTSLSKEQRREKALAMMAKVGLKTEHYDRYPHMFSGGQRQRIAIARGLMLDRGDRRRTGFRAGRFGARAGAEPDDGFTAGSGAFLRLYLPRSVGRGAYR